MLVLCRAVPCLVPYAWASKQEVACQEPSRVGVAQSGTVYSVLGCLLSHRENREQSRTPSSTTAALWALQSLGSEEEHRAHMLHGKIPGTLHLHCRPENTQRDSVERKKKIPGLCFLIPVCKKITTQLREIMGELCARPYAVGRAGGAD